MQEVNYSRTHPNGMFVIIDKGRHRYQLEPNYPESIKSETTALAETDG